MDYAYALRLGGGGWEARQCSGSEVHTCGACELGAYLSIPGLDGNRTERTNAHRRLPAGFCHRYPDGWDAM